MGSVLPFLTPWMLSMSMTLIVAALLHPDDPQTGGKQTLRKGKAGRRAVALLRALLDSSSASQTSSKTSDSPQRTISPQASNTIPTTLKIDSGADEDRIYNARLPSSPRSRSPLEGVQLELGHIPRVAGGKYAAYKIIVTLPGRGTDENGDARRLRWVKWQRVSDFSKLKSALMKVKGPSGESPAVELPALPYSYRHIFDPEYLKKRIARLERFIQALMAEECLRNSSEFVAFISPEPGDAPPQWEGTSEMDAGEVSGVTPTNAGTNEREMFTPGDLNSAASTRRVASLRGEGINTDSSGTVSARRVAPIRPPQQMSDSEDNGAFDDGEGEVGRSLDGSGSAGASSIARMAKNRALSSARAVASGLSANRTATYTASAARAVAQGASKGAKQLKAQVPSHFKLPILGKYGSDRRRSSSGTNNPNANNVSYNSNASASTTPTASPRSSARAGASPS